MRSNKIGDEGATAIAKSLEVNASLTNINLLKNDIGTEVATQLTVVLQQHKTLKTLCGIKPDQAEANFKGQGLKGADGILIAADLLVNASLTSLGCA